MKNLYVGNLAFSTTEEQIREMFQPYGAIEKINVVRDQDSGQPRGFAFVEMTSDGAAAKAIENLNGRDLQGRTLTVNEAQQRSGGGESRRAGMLKEATYSGEAGLAEQRNSLGHLHQPDGALGVRQPGEKLIQPIGAARIREPNRRVQPDLCIRIRQRGAKLGQLQTLVRHGAIMPAQVLPSPAPITGPRSPARRSALYRSIRVGSTGKAHNT